jgi:hypothetical protein
MVPKIPIQANRTEPKDRSQQGVLPFAYMDLFSIYEQVRWCLC